MNKKAYINGKFITSKNTYEIIGPDNLVVGVVPALNVKDINYAFKSARQAQKAWAGLKIQKRIKLLLKLADALEKKIDIFTQMMIKEIAKPKSQAKLEIKRTSQLIKDVVNEYKKIYQKNISGKSIGDSSKNVVILKKPLGVILAISPFNYPVNLAIAKIAPALVTGNSVIFKAATNGTLVGSLIAETIHECNFPKGIFNFVTGKGSDIGDILTSHKEIDAISFTGSELVGINISKISKMANVILELGGKDAAIIAPDANLDLTVKEVVKGAFSYSGQRCTAIKRVFITKENKKEFMQKLLLAIQNLVVGHAQDDAYITPVISKDSKKFIMELVNDAIKEGAVARTQILVQNNLIHPIILDKVTQEMRIAREEQFGPVLPIIEVKNLNQAIEFANDSNYGLQTSIFTQNITLAKKLAHHLEVGSVNINGSSQRGPDFLPFTGIKNSGLNVQGIKYSIESMTRPFNIVNNK